MGNSLCSKNLVLCSSDKVGSLDKSCATTKVNKSTPCNPGCRESDFGAMNSLFRSTHFAFLMYLFLSLVFVVSPIISAVGYYTSQKTIAIYSNLGILVMLIISLVFLQQADKLGLHKVNEILFLQKHSHQRFFKFIIGSISFGVSPLVLWAVYEFHFTDSERLSDLLILSFLVILPVMMTYYYGTLQSLMYKKFQAICKINNNKNQSNNANVDDEHVLKSFDSPRTLVVGATIGLFAVAIVCGLILFQIKFWLPPFRKT